MASAGACQRKLFQIESRLQLWRSIVSTSFKRWLSLGDNTGCIVLSMPLLMQTLHLVLLLF